MLRSIREPVSALTHGFSALFAIFGLVLMIQAANQHGTIWHLISFVIYGISMFLMFFSSAMYHWVQASPKTLQSLRRFDHMMIFVMIAGSFTPFCLVVLHGTLGWVLFGLMWGIAVMGILMKIVWMHAPRWLSTGAYVGMGWLGLVPVYSLYKALPLEGLSWLVAGGVLYTLGALVYGLKKPDPLPEVFGFHEVWHLFVMAGSFCHFWSIYRFVTFLKPTIA
jgi:hemolysin III